MHGQCVQTLLDLRWWPSLLEIDFLLNYNNYVFVLHQKLFNSFH